MILSILSPSFEALLSHSFDCFDNRLVTPGESPSRFPLVSYYESYK